MQWLRIGLPLLVAVLLTGPRALDAQPAPRPAEPGPVPQVLPQPPAIVPLEVELGLVSPSTETLFRAESEASFLERLRRDALQHNVKATFPADAVPPADPVTAVVRLLPPRLAVLGMPVSCRRPLYMEDRSTERYGWYVPYLQPALSAGRFYVDTLLVPYRLAVRPPWTRTCDPLHPAPGDAVPYQVRTPR